MEEDKEKLAQRIEELKRQAASLQHELDEQQQAPPPPPPSSPPVPPAVGLPPTPPPIPPTAGYPPQMPPPQAGAQPHWPPPQVGMPPQGGFPPPPPMYPPSGPPPHYPPPNQGFGQQPPPQWMQAQQAPPPPAQPAKQPSNGMERFIGGDLLSKLGISFVVIGICAFIVYALENNLLGNVGQIVLGVASGLGLIGLGWAMRPKYGPFSTVFIGGGLALLYFTVYIAFNTNAFASQALAFGTLIIVTALSVGLSLKFNRIELAILAVAGAYLTPIVLRSGMDGNFYALFSYLLVLNAGMLALSIYKKWIALSAVALGFTAIVFMVWLSLPGLVYPNASYGAAYGFLFFFTVLFFIGSLVYTIRHGEAHAGMNITILVVNALFAVCEGAYLLIHWRMTNDITFAHALFLAVLHGAAAVFMLQSRNKNDNHGNALALLSGLLLLAAPLIALDMKLWLVWTALGSFVFVALGRSMNFRGFVNAGQIAVFISWIGVFMDLAFYYGGKDALYGFHAENPPLFLNWVSMGALLTILSGLGQYVIVRNQEGTPTNWMMGPKTYGYLLLSSMVGIVYLTGMFEIVDYADQESSPLWIRSAELAAALFSVVFFAFAVLLLPAKRIGYLLEVLVGFGVLSVFICTILAVSRMNSIQENSYAFPIFQGKGISGAWWTSLSSIIFTIIALWRMYQREGSKGALFAIMQWSAVVTILYYFSFLLRYIYVEVNATNVEEMAICVRQIHRTGYTILWGATAFLLIITGLVGRLPQLRYAGLSLLLLLSVKLLIMDLSESSTIAKIAAFIILGFLMLIISFTYQRLVRYFDEK